MDGQLSKVRPPYHSWPAGVEYYTRAEAVMLGFKVFQVGGGWARESSKGEQRNLSGLGYFLYLGDGIYAVPVAG